MSDDDKGLNSEAAVPTPCFVSYRHADEDDLGGVASKFASSLSAYYEAHTGHSLKVFVDRQTIGWGDDWREQIRDGVRNALVFLPIVTMRYFDSPACCEELMAFYSDAKILGVTELLLPIVVLGSANIRSNDSREEVRLIERLQYEDLEEAWVSGSDSREWRTALVRIAKRLDGALRTAEERLRKGPQGGSAVSSARGGGPPADPHADASSGGKRPGVTEDLSEEQSAPDITALITRAEELLPHVERALSAATTFSTVTTDRLTDDSWASMPTAQRNARLIGVAEEVKPAAQDLELTSDALLGYVSEFDAQLRAVIGELGTIEDVSAHGIRTSLISAVGKAGDLSPAVDQLGSVATQLRTLSLLSFQLRQALRPGINGLQTMRTAMTIISSWRRLAESD